MSSQGTPAIVDLQTPFSGCLHRLSSAGLKRLKAYADAHGGDFNVPHSHSDFKLYSWMASQRGECKKYEADPATSTLTSKRLEMLEQVGAILSWKEAALRRSTPKPDHQSDGVLKGVGATKAATAAVSDDPTSSVSAELVGADEQSSMSTSVSLSSAEAS